MGMSVNKPRAGGRRHRPMGEINVTPFVDVMLVLLIVFMVTAPLLTVGVEVDLPKTKAGQINAEIEGWIRAEPEQWFWPHRRWGKILPHSR